MPPPVPPPGFQLEAGAPPARKGPPAPPPGFELELPALDAGGPTPEQYAASTPFGKTVYDSATSGPVYGREWLRDQMAAYNRAPGSPPPPPPGFALEQPGDGQMAPTGTDNTPALGFGDTIANLGRGVGERFRQLTGGMSSSMGALGKQAAEAFPSVPSIVIGGEEGFGVHLQDAEDVRRQTESGALADLSDILESAGAESQHVSLGYTPQTQWQDVKDAEGIAPTLAAAAKFALEQGVISAPDMAAVLANLPGYALARTGELSQSRVDYRQQQQPGTYDEISGKDLAIGGGAAAVSALLEKFGAEKVLEHVPGLDKAILGRILKAGGAEAGTEAAQEVVEYGGERAAQEVGPGMSLGEALDRAAGAAVGGAGAGMAMHGGAELAKSAADAISPPEAPGEAPAPEGPEGGPEAAPLDVEAQLGAKALGDELETAAPPAAPEARTPAPEWTSDPDAGEGVPFAFLGPAPETAAAYLTEEGDQVVATLADGREVGRFMTPAAAALAVEDALQTPVPGNPQAPTAPQAAPPADLEQAPPEIPGPPTPPPGFTLEGQAPSTPVAGFGDLAIPEPAAAPVKAPHAAGPQAAPALETAPVKAPHGGVPEAAAPANVQPAAADRRANRKRVADMTPAELRQSLLTHELTGIPNRRAYEEAPKLPSQTAIDVDSLKWVNDNMGHDSGNELLRAVGEALREEGGPNVYHLSGDEFAMQAQTDQQAAELMQRVNDRLAGAVISVTMPDGTVHTLSGMGVSYGTGKDLAAADAGLQAHKTERESRGERSGRGLAPPGATRVAAEEGRADHEGSAAAASEAEAPAARQRGEERAPTGEDVTLAGPFAHTAPRDVENVELGETPDSTDQVREEGPTGRRALKGVLDELREQAATAERAGDSSLAMRIRRAAAKLKREHEAPDVVQEQGGAGDYTRELIAQARLEAEGFEKAGEHDKAARYRKIADDVEKLLGRTFGGKARGLGDDLERKPYGVDDVREGTTKEQIKNANELLAESEKLADKYEGDVNTLAVVFNNDFQEDHSTSLLGKKIKTPEDLAVLAQVYRNPRYETLRYYLLNREHKIVWESGVSARLPASSGAFPIDKSWDWLKQAIKRTGATHFRMLHNHPSGLSSPSETDIAFTARARGQLGLSEIEHVVIDSNEYSVITSSGSRATPQVTQHKLDLGEDALLKPSKPHLVLGYKIVYPNDVAKLGRELQAPGYLTLVGSSRGSVRALGETPALILSDVNKTVGQVKRFGLSTGSADLFLVGLSDEQIDNNEPTMRALFKGGFVRDVVSTSGRSAAEEGRYWGTGREYGTTAGEATRIEYEREAKPRKKAPAAAAAPTSTKPEGGVEEPAYHGSPHKFDKFSLEHVGTGEGEAAYGWGLYFAEAPGVAHSYKLSLTDHTAQLKALTREENAALPSWIRDRIGAEGKPGVESVRLDFEGRVREETAAMRDGKGLQPHLNEIRIQRATEVLKALDKIDAAKEYGYTRAEGSVYKVDIADAAVPKMIDADEDLEAQKPEVIAALKRLEKALGFSFEWDRNGQAAYSRIGNAMNMDHDVYEAAQKELADDPPRSSTFDEAASKLLAKFGIPGLRYLDQDSRQGRPRYDGDPAYLHAATDLHMHQYAIADARRAIRKAYPDARDTWLMAAINEAYDVKPKGTRNLVVFDDSIVTIKEINGEKVTPKQSASMMEKSAAGGAEQVDRVGEPRNLAQTTSPQFRDWFGESKVVDEKGEPLVVYHTTTAKDFDAFRRRGAELGLHFGTEGQARDLFEHRTRTYAGRAKMRKPGSAPRTIPVYLKIENPLELEDVAGKWDHEAVYDAITGGEGSKEALKALEPLAEELGRMPTHQKDTLPKLRAWLQSKGYDGIVYANRYEFGGKVPDLRAKVDDLTNEIAALRKRDPSSDMLGELREQQDEAQAELNTERDKEEAASAKSWIAFEPTQIKSAIGNTGAFDATNPDMVREGRAAPEISSPVEGTYVAHLDGREVGRVNLDEEQKYVVSVRVEPEYRRQGIATALYAHIEKELGHALEQSPRHTTPEGKAFRASREKVQKVQPASGPGKSGIRGQAGANYVSMYRSKGAPQAATAGKVGTAARSSVLEVPKEPIRREHVMKLFQRLFHVKIYEGKPFKVRNALGYFRPSNFEIRNKDRNDLEVAAHEVFHWIDRTYPTIRKLYHKKRFADELYGVSYDDTKIFEGFAEFGRLFMTQEPEAITRLPTFYEAFVKEARDAGILDKLEEVQKLMHQWYLQGAENRARSKIGTAKAPIRQRLGQMADGFVDRAIASSLDRLQAAKVIERETKGAIADDAAMSPYKSMRLLAGARSTINTFLNHGTLAWTERGDLDFNGKGLRQIFEPVHDVFDEAMGYFVAQRANELRRYSKENLFTPDEIKALHDRAFKTGKLEAIERAHEQYQAYTKRVLSFAQQSGILSAKTRATWEAMYQNYVPFYRVAEKFGSLDPRMAGGTRGGLFRRLTGGTANVADVFENITLNTALIVHASLKNVAKRQLFAAIESSPIGQRYAVKIPESTEIRQVAIEQIKRVLREFAKEAEAGYRDAAANNRPAAAMEYAQLAQLAAALASRDKDLGQMPMEEVMQQATFYFTGKPPTIPDKEQVLINGKPRWYQIGDPMLWDMLTELNYHQPIGITEKVFGVAKRALTRGVTVTPEFQIANIIRDTFNAFAMSKGKQLPVVDAMKAMRDIWSESDDYKLFLANGGGFGNAIGDEAKRLRVQMKATGTRRLLATPAELVDFWDKWGQSFELATRLAEYKKVKAQGATMREAAFQGREVSTDFAMRGNSALARWASISLAFFNARLQGLYRIERELFEKKGRQSWTGERALAYASRAFLGLTVPSLLVYWLLNRDDDDYEDLGEEVKSLNTVLPLPGGGGVALIPRPFETGALFQEIPIRLWEYYRKRDGAKLARAAEFMVANTFNFNPVPQAVSPAVDVFWKNRQWNGLPVIPRSLENVEPREQFQPWTSETMKKVGEQFNVSPIKLEQLVNGYFGTLGLYMLAASDALVTAGGPEEPGKKLAQYPLFRRFMREQPYANTSFEERFYDMLDETTKVVTTANKLRREARADDLEHYLSNADKALYFGLSKTAADVAEKAADLNAQMRAIRQNGVMTADAKATEIDELQGQQNALFKEAVTELEAARLAEFRDAIERQ